MHRYISYILAGVLALNAMEVSAQKYSNPIIRRDCPDPTILDDRSRSGWFYVYSTQSLKDESLKAEKDAAAKDESQVINLPVYRSKDLINWEFVGDGFPAASSGHLTSIMLTANTSCTTLWGHGRRYSRKAAALQYQTVLQVHSQILEKL